MDDKELFNHEEDNNDDLVDDIINSLDNEKADNNENTEQGFVLDITDYDLAFNDDENNHIQNIDDEDGIEKPKKKKGYKGLIFGLLLTTFIVCASLILAYIILSVGKDVMGIDKSSNPVTIEIPLGATSHDIAEILESNGVIKYPLVFRAVVKMQSEAPNFQEGTFEIRPDYSYEDIISELCKINNISITIPEGYNLVQIAQKLEDNNICKKEDFLYEINSKNFEFDFENLITQGDLEFYKMEGFAFPDTYFFKENMDADLVAKKFIKNFSEKLNADHYARMSNMGITLEQTITLASIVQAESANIEDMKMVASVFWNRLNNSSTFPKLQSDPTSKYVREVIKPNIQIENENIYNAYDTYKGIGLPPGAICNPGIDAINAVLYPADSDYYYFCSNINTGVFYYAKTNAEHEKNLKLAGLK